MEASNRFDFRVEDRSRLRPRALLNKDHYTRLHALFLLEYLNGVSFPAAHCDQFHVLDIEVRMAATSPLRPAEVNVVDSSGARSSK